MSKNNVYHFSHYCLFVGCSGDDRHAINHEFIP